MGSKDKAKIEEKKKTQKSRFKQIRNSLRAREQHVFTMVTSNSRLSKLWAAGNIIFQELHRHYVLTRPDLIEDTKEHDKTLKGKNKVNLDRVRHFQRHALSTSYMGHLKRGVNIVRTESKWRKAKKNSDFSIVEDEFTSLVKGAREIGERKATVMKLKSPYDALMDEFTPNNQRKKFDAMIMDLENWLPEKQQKIANKFKNWEEPNPDIWELPIWAQKALCHRILERMGFDFKNGGKLSESAHPLCLGSKGDIKITLDYSKKDFFPAILAAVHECGHALYRQNLPDEWKHHPAGEIPSQSMDEAMALLMENHVGRSKGFAKFVVETLRDEFGIEKNDLTEDAIYKRMVRVGHDRLRGNADEVSYPLHLIMRYRLGRRLIEGNLEVKELPAAWKRHEKKYFGWESKNDKEGCLQDIHWYSGQFGYFPSYFMGSMIAAQLYEKAAKDDRNIDKSVDNFDIKPLTKWLKANIYENASKFETQKLVKKVTGEELSTEAYKRLVTKKYLSMPFIPSINGMVNWLRKGWQRQLSPANTPDTPNSKPNKPNDNGKKSSKSSNLPKPPKPPNLTNIFNRP